MIRLIGRKEDPRKIAEMVVIALGAPVPGLPELLPDFALAYPGTSDWYRLDVENRWQLHREKGDFIVSYCYSRVYEHALAAKLRRQYGWILQEERDRTW